MDLLKGFLSAGYASWLIEGRGGTGSLDFVLLKAFRSDANDVFFEKGEPLLFVATED